MAATLPHRNLLFWPGLASLVLGTVGLLLFFLPILSIPLAGTGLLIGLFALLTAVLGGRTSLRWSVLGTTLCILTLAADLTIALAPVNSMAQETHPHSWQEPLRPIYVAPPADPRLWMDSRDR
jgi:hypothetical protein